MESLELQGGFPVRYGHGALAELVESVSGALVVTMEDIWPAVKRVCSFEPEQIFFVRTLEIEELEKAAAGLSGFDCVVGIGGGSAADVAKFIHMKTGADLYQVPSILSVDAFFTHEIAVRDRGVVRYIGDESAVCVYVDYDLIGQAPVDLNRSGLGDILSCHTGLHDWRLAAAAGCEPVWNQRLADQTLRVLDHVRSRVEEFARMSEHGIRSMAGILNWIGHNCYIQGHPRFEEGSEHHFVYNLEYLTGKNFIHGQMVCLGIALMSLLQDNDAPGIRATIRQAGIEIRPERIGLTWSEVDETLNTLAQFAHRNRLPHTVLQEREITPEFLREAHELVEAL
jgi:glycerol dehydrogenase-like iron-containing ADH family enzyme